MEDRFWEELLHSHGHVFQEELIYLPAFFPSGVQWSSSVGELCHVEKSEKVLKHQMAICTMGGCQNPWFTVGK